MDIQSLEDWKKRYDIERRSLQYVQRWFDETNEAVRKQIRDFTVAGTDFREENLLTELQTLLLCLDRWPASSEEYILVYVDISYKEEFYRNKRGEKIYYPHGKEHIKQIGTCIVRFTFAGELTGGKARVFRLHPDARRWRSLS